MGAEYKIEIDVEFQAMMEEEKKKQKIRYFKSKKIINIFTYMLHTVIMLAYK